MTAIDEVQHPHRPLFQQQGPDANCMIEGHALGWSSCTAYAMAMDIDRITAGSRRPSGCAVRRMTVPLDVSGGLNLNQVAAVARERYGLAISVYTGPNVVSAEFVARQIRAGRSTVVQGDAIAMVGTRFQSTAGAVAHAVEISEVRGGTLDRPGEARVSDPAADGRKRSYHVDQGPSWWPWDLVEAFAADLRPNGAGSPRLGPGKVYCAIGPDTEPHVTLVDGAHLADPFPDRARAGGSPTRVHSRRERGPATTTRRIPKGTLVRLYQYAKGEVHEGSPWWGGNDDGTEWIHLKNLTHARGTT